MSQRQNTTNGKPVQKKTGNRQNNSLKQQSRINSRAAAANARNGGVSGMNLGGMGAMSSAPVAMSKTVRTGVPKMTTLRNGDCRIVHREYIQDIVAPSTGANFNVTTLQLNPGLASFVPWLSKIAQNFESYRFERLKFDYETEAPSSLGGTLILALDYDSSDAPPLTKQQALAYRGSVRSAPWTPCQHRSVKEDLNKQKSYFVRPGSKPSGTDIRLWDVGALNVVTQGITSNSASCGELYVEYDILLMTPVYEPFPASSTVYASAATTAAPLLAGVVAGNLISSITDAGLVNLQNLIVGQEYFIFYGSTGTAAFVWTVGTLVGLTAKSTFTDDSGTYVSGYSVIATASSASFQNTVGTANPGAALLVVSQIPVSVL